MKCIISERQYKLLVGEQEAADKFADPVAVTKSDGGVTYSVFSCVEVEPMTIWGSKNKVYPINHPKDVSWEFIDEGKDGDGKKYKKWVNVIFKKWKDPSSDTRDFHPWITIEGQIWLQDKKSYFFKISNINNTFKCGAKYSINIDFKNVSDPTVLVSPEVVDVDLKGLPTTSITTDVFEFPSFGSFTSLKSFADKVNQIKFNFDKM
tara:strand:+ start:7986 stop:8603 length:618 start_codon:yes stop_codon:yes gene_type:complete